MASKRIAKKVLVGLIALQGALVLLLFGVLLYLFRAAALGTVKTGCRDDSLFFT